MKLGKGAVPEVRNIAKQGTEAPKGAESEIWTECMLAALANGVKGGKWFSLIDKVL